VAYIRGCQKSSPLKNFAIFQTTIESYFFKYLSNQLQIQFVANLESSIALSIYRIDNTTLLLTMATWRFDVIKN